ncbi:MAG: 2,3-bisphosphoglycerate-independent phosphoglycerate mutase, partial [bacterium]
LDGMGIRKSELGNSVIGAKTPVLDSLWTQYPHCLLDASEKAVGLPQGYAGHSEVGHLNIGSGQIVHQVLTQIGESIRTKQFEKIPVLVESLKATKKKGSAVHLLGILSPGGVHGHIDHLFELMRVCKKHGVEIFIHGILDGRDSGLQDGYLYLNMLNSKITELGVGKLASLSGRAYAMDRNKNWDRTGKTYKAMIGDGERKASDVMDVLQNAYKSGENDQTFKPTTMVDEKGDAVGPVKDGDTIIFYNYREDRSRQLTKCFVQEDCNGFIREKMLKDLDFITMTGYERGLPVKTLFDSFIPENTISDVISRAGMKQYHISETEKYAHVTYFFNGGREELVEGEEFFLIPSPDVFDYSATPAMSIEPVTKEAIKRIESEGDDFVLINFANPDMLGHTGDYDATVKSLEIMDKMTGMVIDAAVKSGYDFIVVSDHGNCDEMIEEITGDPNTMHSLSPVPFIVGQNVEKFQLLENAVKIGTGGGSEVRGILADSGVTVLAMLGLEPTEDMTGINLVSIITQEKLEKQKNNRSQ